MKPLFFDLCLTHNMKLAVVESVTGGAFASMITQYPYASKIFELGMITYSDNSKVETLGVDAGLLATYGAISKEVAEAMAIAILDKAKANISIAFTGNAGPSAQQAKPVGLAFTAIASKDAVVVYEDYLSGTRKQIQKQLCINAQARLLQFIQATIQQ